MKKGVNIKLKRRLREILFKNNSLGSNSRNLKIYPLFCGIFTVIGFFWSYPILANSEINNKITPNFNLKGQLFINNQVNFLGYSSKLQIIRRIMNNIIFENFEVAVNGISDNLAISIMAEFNSNYSSLLDDDFTITNCLECQSEEFVGRPLQIICNISHVSTPIPILLRDKGTLNRRESISRLSLRDRFNNELETVDIESSELSRSYNSFRSLLKVRGTIISIVQKDFRGYLFFIKEIIPHITQFDLVRTNCHEMETIAGFVNQLASEPNGLRTYLKNELVEMFNIKGLESATELNKAIDFTIVQALTSGMSTANIYPNKLHSCIIGAPASGKKLITRCALALSPNGIHVSSSSSKVTAAGLVGIARISREGYVSLPGILPSANDGVVCFEDFHELTKKKNEISGILSQVMEDGKIDDSSAAKTTHIACVSINVDMNRRSQVNHTGVFDSYQDLNIPLNIISRFDFISEIPPDPIRQMKVSLDMVGRFGELHSEIPGMYPSEQEKKLKQIVAYVNTTYRTVSVSDNVNEYIRTKLKEIFETNQQLASVQKHMGSMLTRLQNSVEKFSKAIATSKLQREVSIEDVDEAFYFISDKLEFLASLGFLDQPSKALPDKQFRQARIIELLNGIEFTMADVQKILNDGRMPQVDGRTLNRDMVDLISIGKAQRVRHGYYKIVA